MATKYATMNKVMLFTIETYIDKCKEDNTEPTPLHNRILSGIKGWKTFKMFSMQEAITVIAISEEKGLQDIISKPISFLVFSLEIMRLLIESYDKDGIPKRDRPYLGISEKHLKGGRALYAVGMLKLKQRDREQYEETKQVIDDSVISAKHFFHYHYERLIK